jgi:hypothetical protein
VVVDAGVVDGVGGTSVVVVTGAPVVGGATDVLEPVRAIVVEVVRAFVVVVDAAFVDEHAPISTQAKAAAKTARDRRAANWLRSPIASGFRS